MARIIGTRHADRLFAPDEPSVVRGLAGNDWIEGGDLGADRLYGDRGDDTIMGGFDYQDTAYGGRGNDRIELAATAYGGVGNDTITGARLGIGGSGNDFVAGIGDLYGGEGPGLTQAVIGSDTLFSVAAGYASTRMTGGLGPLQGEAVHGVLTITLKPREQGTQIRWRYSVGGMWQAKSIELAPLVDKVLGEQVRRLADSTARLAP